jgi:hypothetical protein
MDIGPNLQAILEGRVSGTIQEWPAVRSELQFLFKRVGELEELTKDMGSDKALAEVLYEYHERAEKAESLLADREADLIKLRNAVENHRRNTWGVGPPEVIIDFDEDRDLYKALDETK